MVRSLIAACAASLLATATAAAGEMWVTIDTATRHQMPDSVGQIVLTNPGVADVQVASATEIMIFGKAPGFTDVVFQTEDGKRIGQVRVRVGNDTRGQVTLYNGGERYSYSCTTRCERALTVGDGGLLSGDELLQQVQLKLGASSEPTALTGEAVQVERSAAPAASGPQG